MHKIELDWNEIENIEQMWEEIVTKSGHPSWHGRNLDALRDGWVTGGLDENGPPYEFVFINCPLVKKDIKKLSVAVMSIAIESIMENGGTINYG